MTLTPQGKTVMNRKLIAAICTPVVLDVRFGLKTDTLN